MRKGYSLAAAALLWVVLLGHGQCRLAFVADIGGNWELCVTDDEGSNTLRLTDTGLDEKEPCWSPDRQSIVYATSDGRLNRIDVTTKETSVIVDEGLGTPGACPCFSPDGGAVAFARYRPPSQGDDTDIKIWDLNTDRTRNGIEQPGIQLWPAWSPDGTRIAYAATLCSGSCGRILQELWIADAGMRWARQLLLTHSFCQQPAWSPDGRSIAFSSDMGGGLDLWTVDLDTFCLTRITTHEGLDVKPAWSPDGRRIAFVSTRSGIMEIWIKDLDTGALHPLRPFGRKTAACRDVAW
ncbi:MAG: hypothetical protein V1793_25755 [Pseudomonadota bacterium]